MALSGSGIGRCCKYHVNTRGGFEPTIVCCFFFLSRLLNAADRPLEHRQMNPDDKFEDEIMMLSEKKTTEL